MRTQNTNYGTPKAKQAIRPVVSKIWKDIEVALGNHARAFFPIYSSRLSIFFGELEQFRGKPEFEAVLKSNVDLFIVTKPPRGSLCVAIDVCDRPLNQMEFKNHQIKMKMFDDKLIQYHQISVANLRDEHRTETIKKILDDLKNKTLPYESKGAIGDSQWWAVDSAYEMCKRKNYACLHEISLNSIIDAPQTWIESAKQRLGLITIRQSYLETKVVDAVITSPIPDAIPLVAIEFDGPEHFRYQQGNYKNDKEKQKAKKMFEKDKLQNEIFLSAGVPLIRIHFDDLPKRQSWESGKSSDARRLFFGLLAEHLAGIQNEQNPSKANSANADLLKQILLLRPSDGLYGISLPVEKPETHSTVSAMLRDSWKLYFTEEDDELVEQEPQYAKNILSDGFNDVSGKIPHGFHPCFEEAENLATDETGVTLKLIPGRYLRLGGYTQPPVFPSVRFRLRVIAKEGAIHSVTQKTFRQELAYLTATINALRTLEPMRAELHQRYTQGIERALRGALD